MLIVAETALTSGSRVAAIPELLEKILLALDPDTTADLQTLLLSQRVSRAFYGTINASKKLQVRLFLIPPGHMRAAQRVNVLFYRTQYCPLRLMDSTELSVEWIGGPHRRKKVDGERAGSTALTVANVTMDRRCSTPSGSVAMARHVVPSWCWMYLYDGHYKIKEVEVTSAMGHRVFGPWFNLTLGELFHEVFPDG